MSDTINRRNQWLNAHTYTFIFWSSLVLETMPLYTLYLYEFNCSECIVLYAPFIRVVNVCMYIFVYLYALYV